MSVSDLVSNGDGSLSRSMTTKAINTIMTQRTWISRVASEIVIQPTYADTGVPLHEERVTTVRKKPNLHPELYQRDVTSGMRTPDRVLHVTVQPLTVETKDAINEGTAHDDAEGCHTDRRCAPREGARGQRHLRFSARDQTSVTSPMRHTRVPRKSRRSPATGSRSVSFSPRRRLAHRHWKHWCTPVSSSVCHIKNGPAGEPVRSGGSTSSRKATETIGTGDRRRARGQTVLAENDPPILLDIQRLRADLAVTSPSESGATTMSQHLRAGRVFIDTRVAEPLFTRNLCVI